MATSNMKVIVNPGGTKRMLMYLLSPSREHAKSARIREPNGERVQYIYSTYLNDPMDTQNIVKEILLAKGKKAESIHFRISFSPEDRKLGAVEIQQFVDHVMKKYLPNRNFIAVCHSDTEHQHIHIITDYLDFNGNPPPYFLKHLAGDEARRRQTAVDEVCQMLGLSTVHREPNKFKRAAEKINKRQIQNMKYSWKADLLEKIEEAMKISRNAKDFEAAMRLQGVDVRWRGRGVSYRFKDQNGKQRVIRGKRLGERFSFTPQELDEILKQKIQEKQPPIKKEVATRKPEPQPSFYLGNYR